MRAVNHPIDAELSEIDRAVRYIGYAISQKKDISICKVFLVEYKVNFCVLEQSACISWTELLNEAVRPASSHMGLNFYFECDSRHTAQ